MSQSVLDITSQLGNVHGGGKWGTIVKGAKDAFNATKEVVQKYDPAIQIGNAARKVKGLWDRATDDK